jgi:hypothetical protein
MAMNDGGPAFPHTGPQRDAGTEGMSLRDYFAAHVMAGMCSAASHYGALLRGAMPGATTAMLRDEACAESYAIADAMLRARTAPSPAEPKAPAETMRAHIDTFGSKP